MGSEQQQQLLNSQPHASVSTFAKNSSAELAERPPGLHGKELSQTKFFQNSILRKIVEHKLEFTNQAAECKQKTEAKKIQLNALNQKKWNLDNINLTIKDELTKIANPLHTSKQLKLTVEQLNPPSTKVSLYSQTKQLLSKWLVNNEQSQEPLPIHQVHLSCPKSKLRTAIQSHHSTKRSKSTILLLKSPSAHSMYICA